MPYFAVDDAFHSHPKALALRAGAYENDALALWAKAGSWCAAGLTDGHIPKYVVESLLRKNALKAAAELVRVKLWHETADGWVFHQWEDHQQSSEEVKAKRSSARERMREVRRQKNGAFEGSSRERSPSVRANNTRTFAERSSTPSLPIPTLPRESASALSESAREAPPEVPVSPAPARHPNAVRSEALRLGYCARFQVSMPGLGLPGVCGPGNGGPWLELARALTDEQVPVLLDAFFADQDPFVSSDRAPSKLMSQRVRLLTRGPAVARASPAKRSTEPMTHDEARAFVEQHAGKGATVHVQKF